MLLTDEDDVGLTDGGIQAVVDEYCEFEGNRQATTRSRLSVQDMYRYLLERDVATATELQAHHRPTDGPPAPDAGRYPETHTREWWADVGRPSLRALPGVDEVDDPAARPPVGREARDAEVWAFTGLDARARDGLDPEHTAPLEELRGAPEVQAEHVLDGLGIPRRWTQRGHTDRRGALLALYETIRQRDVTTEALLAEIEADDRTRGYPPREFLEDVRDSLTALPGVEVETFEPRAPSEIPVETMADVLEAQRELERDPEETWTFAPGAGGGA